MMKNTISSRNTAIIQAKTLVFSAYSGNWSCFSSNSLIMRRLRAFSCHFRAIFLLFRRALQVCAEFYRKIGLRLLEGVFLLFSSFLLFPFLVFSFLSFPLCSLFVCFSIWRERRKPLGDKAAWGRAAPSRLLMWGCALQIHFVLVLKFLLILIIFVPVLQSLCAINQLHFKIDTNDSIQNEHRIKQPL